MGNVDQCCQTNQPDSVKLQNLFNEKLLTDRAQLERDNDTLEYSLLASNSQLNSSSLSNKIRIKPTLLEFPKPPITYLKAIKELQNGRVISNPGGQKRYILFYPGYRKMILQCEPNVANSGNGYCLLSSDDGKWIFDGLILSFKFSKGILAGQTSYWEGKFFGGADDQAVSGEGTIQYENGDRYKGRFMNGLREGEGHMTWTNGDSYRGTWKEGRRDGHGTMVTRDLSYTGQWDKDKRVGRAIVQDKQGKKFDTVWMDDICVG